MLQRTLLAAARALPVAAACLLVAGCSSDANPVRDLAVSVGVTGGEPKPAPDFVSRTRREDVDYVPVGVSPPRRAHPRKKQDVDKAEAELNQTRQRNEARGQAARKAAGPAPTAATPAR